MQVDGDESSWFATLPTILDATEQAASVLEVVDSGGDDVARLEALYAPLRQSLDGVRGEVDHGGYAGDAA